MRTVSVEGPRPPDEVWDAYVHPRRWPEWSPQIRSVEYGPERIVPGTTGVVRGPFRLPVRFRILSVQERAWSWRAGVAGITLTLTHTVEGVAAGTRTGLAVSGFGPVVLLYLPVARLALRRLVG